MKTYQLLFVCVFASSICHCLGFTSKRNTSRLPSSQKDCSCEERKESPDWDNNKNNPLDDLRKLLDRDFDHNDRDKNDNGVWDLLKNNPLASLQNLFDRRKDDSSDEERAHYGMPQLRDLKDMWGSNGKIKCDAIDQAWNNEFDAFMAVPVVQACFCKK